LACIGVGAGWYVNHDKAEKNRLALEAEKARLSKDLVETTAKYAWEGVAAQTTSRTLQVVYGAVRTFREIANLEGQNLAAFVKCARMRVILPELTKDEAELLAWYAHESCRIENNGIVGWNVLAPGVRERKVLDAYNYVTEQAVNPHLAPEFYTALDIFLSDAANYAAKLDKLRKAQTELSKLPANWTVSFRQQA
jgi:hypothetical protein